MSSLAEVVSPRVEIVDLGSVRAEEITVFLEREVALWRDRCLWDVSASVSSLRRAIERGSLQGKAARLGSTTAAFAYHLIEGDRGIVSGMVLDPENGPQIGQAILGAVVAELRRRRCRRIESQFVSFDVPWMVSCFERLGFRTHWREFLRLPLRRLRLQTERDPALWFSGFKTWNVSEASNVMRSAHEGSVDSEMNELYRTLHGCRALLNNILRQRGCGRSVEAASAIAREAVSRRAIGFSLVTEIAARQAHLAQLAVLPSFQRRGVGRFLIEHGLEKLARDGFETVSLMVSRGNTRALELYRRLGFVRVFRFPVFSWDAAARGPGPRSR